MLYVSAQPQIAQNAKAISTEVSTEATEENLRRSRNASSKVFSFGQSLSIPKMLKALGNRGFRPCLPLRKRTQRPPNFEGEVGRGELLGWASADRGKALKWKMVLPLRGIGFAQRHRPFPESCFWGGFLGEWCATFRHNHLCIPLCFGYFL